jgi:hypothetical protein
MRLKEVPFSLIKIKNTHTLKTKRCKLIQTSNFPLENIFSSSKLEIGRRVGQNRKKIYTFNKNSLQFNPLSSQLISKHDF